MGEEYDFQPAVSDADGDAVTFSIQNLPSWARFDGSTGRLSGMPGAADVGTYPGISIRVADAESQTALATFTVEVVQMGMGSATLSWVAPEKNTDGSVLRNLEGFLVHFGRSASNLSREIRIKNASIDRYVVDNLGPGTWYFGVTAFNSNNLESAMSTVLSKVIE